MKHLRNIGLMVALAMAITAVVYVQKPAREASTAYERVTRGKVIRCGYVVYEPYISKDPNTGKLSGVTVDYLNGAAKRQGLKIDWMTEINFDQVVPALDAGKIDMLCVPCTPTSDYERVVAFVGNLGGLPYYTYVATKNEVRPQELPTATFALHDGYALSGITRNAYPNAQFISLPQSASMAEFFDQLRFGKAQAVVNENIAAENYMKNNPNVMRRLSDTPVIAMRMFLLAQKTDTAMHGLIEKTFGLEDPANLASMRDLVVKYNVPKGSLLLGEDCNPALNDKGWKICEPNHP